MASTNRAIWRKFGIRTGDVLPYRASKGTRLDLCDLFGELGYKIGAEIGVEQGNYSLELCSRIAGLKLYCIDPYTTYFHHSAEEMGNVMKMAQDKVSKFNTEFIRKPSLDAVNDLPDGCLDFVYIDGMHDFDNVMRDIIVWAPKVKSGGIVAGHDYSHRYGYGVVSAVDVYTKIHDIKSCYITKELLDPSWLWVR